VFGEEVGQIPCWLRLGSPEDLMHALDNLAGTAASRSRPLYGARSYLGMLLGLILLGVCGIAGFNILIDPLWFFAHENYVNRAQLSFDERAQKTNWLQSHAGEFDAVLLGSSRSTYIGQPDFAPWRLFNYSVSGMWPLEYRPYLEHFTKVNGQPPRRVVLGVDFFGSGLPSGEGPRPEGYIDRAGDPRYVAGSLLSLDLLTKSLATFYRSLGLGGDVRSMDHYDRSNVRYLSEALGEADRQRAVLKNLEGYRDRQYGPQYVYNPQLQGYWRELRAAYPDTQFAVFTTPIAEPLFALMIRMGHFDHYARWLSELVTEFGEVWDFMGINSVTSQPGQYRDAEHFNERIGRMIADRLLGRPVPADHADFGRRVTRENLAAHLEFIRRQLPCLDPDPIRTARARVAGAWVTEARCALPPLSLDASPSTPRRLTGNRG
jgi:hypothetical protein